MPLIDWFVPPRARADAARERRYRGAITLLLVMSGTVAVLLLFYLLVRSAPTRPELALFATCMVIPVFGALMIRGSGRILYGLVLTNLAAILLVGVWAYLTGGILSPVMPWFLANLALLATFGNLLLLGVVGGALLLTISVLYYGSIRGWLPASLVTPALAHEFVLLAMLSAIVVVVFAAASVMRERAAVEARLRDARDAAESANRAKSAFLSSVSHELRTPLATVIGFAEVLKFDDKAPLSASQAMHVDNILIAGDHLLALVNQVIEMSRIEAGEVEMRFEDVRAAELIDACVAMMALPAAERGVTLNNRAYESAGVILRADPTRLKQVMLNLLSNAVKFNRDLGSVTVEVRRGGDGRVRILVADTGRGISAARRHELFQSFSRLGVESGGISGGGLGLAISGRLVQMMQGRIGCESTEGQGSTFWVELPSAS